MSFAGCQASEMNTSGVHSEDTKRDSRAGVRLFCGSSVSFNPFASSQMFLNLSLIIILSFATVPHFVFRKVYK